MVILSRRTINKFIEKYPSAKDPLVKWFLDMQATDLKNLGDLKKRFSSVDYVEDDLYVFNIGGNKWRLIARIIFGARTVFIRFIGTHAQYDKVKVSDL